MYDCVKEGVFLEDQGILVGGCRALQGSVESRISVAFVGIYSPNKDLVGDTWAGCVYIKGDSQRRAAANCSASGNAAAMWRQSYQKVQPACVMSVSMSVAIRRVCTYVVFWP